MKKFKEMEREEMDNLWESVYYTPDLKRKIKDMAPGLIEFLMRSLLMEEEIGVGSFKDGKSYGSSVCYDEFNTDKMLHLRYKNDTTFELFIALENDDAGRLEFFRHTLTDREELIIPEGLRMMMKTAFNKDEEMVWRPGEIDKK